ncbi:MAG: N-acetylmuramoyl-L-alanine amidase [Defluviitaleaceae bacterium]|nr:N-acetylmuramoyl-L-alanine amidase [Defluviitaleaceae bacterium]
MIKRFIGFYCLLTLIFIFPMVLSAASAQQLTVVQPRRDVTTEGSGFNIFGASDPEKGLYINGKPVTNRTEEGFYSIFMPLSLGENIFTLSQEGQRDVVRIVERRPAALPPHPTMNIAAITTVFPAVEEYVSVGDTIKFSATAPVGATVKLNFRGDIINLAPAHRFPNPREDGRIYATTFSASIQIPAIDSTDEIVNLSRPIYIMEWDGQVFTEIAASIRLINRNAPFYATVTADTAWTFPNPTIAGGSGWNLLKGQKAAVRAISGNGGWVKLESGMWIERENVAVTLEDEVIADALTAGQYVKGEFRDRIIWPASLNPAARVTFDGNVLRIYFAMQRTVPPINLSDIEPDEMFFSEKAVGIYKGTPYYAFTIRDRVNIEGFYTSFENGEFALNIRRRRTLTGGDKPLLGFNFVIDAGHGKQDYGALGPMGTAMAEKHLNLINAQNLAAGLENLGAKVTLVRDTDIFFTLQERTDISRRVKPDMFISIHANSTAEITDATNIHGITFWYRNPNSKPLAEHLMTSAYNVNPMTTRNMRANHANFFVCRPAWTPSVIVETSFMNNIQDFAWMIREDNQRILAERLVRAILSYYSKRH